VDQISGAGQGNNWLEPMREFIKASSQAKNSVDLENNQEVLSFLKNIGSNFLLKGKKISDLKPK
jgi:site-specific DNA recombinase